MVQQSEGWCDGRDGQSRRDVEEQVSRRETWPVSLVGIQELTPNPISSNCSGRPRRMMAESKEFVSKSRLDALTDGVFAFAMTLLVVKFDLPEDFHATSAAELVSALLGLGGTFVAYVVSFLVLASFWLGRARTKEEAGGRRMAVTVRDDNRIRLSCSGIALHEDGSWRASHSGAAGYV
jgi:hypothetical protein